MTKRQSENPEGLPSKDRSAVTGSHRRTLAMIFRHPISHNLEWTDVVALIETIGEVEKKANGEFSFRVGGEHHLFRKPHTKDFTAPELLELRHFIERAGWSPELPSQPTARPAPAAPNLMVVVDHHGAKIYQIDVMSDDTAMHVIKPYDPHHFLHHLAHKDKPRERGQRAPETPSFYEQISSAVALAAKIVVVGHGIGKSNAADHLAEYLRSHHHETYQRIARVVVADLSHATTPQLLEIARTAMR